MAIYKATSYAGRLRDVIDCHANFIVSVPRRWADRLSSAEKHTSIANLFVEYHIVRVDPSVVDRAIDQTVRRSQDHTGHDEREATPWHWLVDIRSKDIRMRPVLFLVPFRSLQFCFDLNAVACRFQDRDCVVTAFDCSFCRQCRLSSHGKGTIAAIDAGNDGDLVKRLHDEGRRSEDTMTVGVCWTPELPVLFER